MFERFTEDARQVVVNGQDEARKLKHNYIGVEHLLLGLLHGPSLAETVLREDLGLHYGDALRRIKEIVPEGDEVLIGQIPFTPRAKKVLELALREALSLGHNYIGPEHILLGLVREPESVAAAVIQAHWGAGPGDCRTVEAFIRDSIIDRLTLLPKVRVEWPRRLIDAADRYLQATAELVELLDCGSIPVIELQRLASDVADEAENLADIAAAVSFPRREQP